MRRFAMAFAGVTVAVSLPLTAVWATASDVLDADPSASGPDGMYARFGAGQGGGVVLVERLDDDSARLTVALTGLVPGSRFRLFIGSQACHHAATSATRIFATWLSADEQGDAFVAEVVPWLWLETPDARSARLMEEEGIYYFCRAPTAFDLAVADPPGPQTADLAFARHTDGSRRGIVLLGQLDGDTGRLTLALGGLKGPAPYRLVASRGACREPVSDDDRLFAVRFGSDAHGTAYASNNDIEVENDESHWVGSFLTRDPQGPVYGCRNAFVAAVHLD